MEINLLLMKEVCGIAASMQTRMLFLFNLTGEYILPSSPIKSTFEYLHFPMFMRF